MSSQNLENYFQSFRKNIIGIDEEFTTPFGSKKIIYADWIASGRLYRPIEDRITNTLGKFVANTHTETSETGMRMTNAYHLSHKIIKNHVNADENDVIITAGSGMTSVINKFQRILGLKYNSKMTHKSDIKEQDRPVVFITHMEHHSNHTSWYETLADVVIVEPAKDLTVEPENLRRALEKYKDRSFKIGSFTACSNVTGIRTPYHELAEIMHDFGGVCIIDFAASAPYDDINMHPENPKQKLDAVLFSPHKFLGGPGSSGVLIFDASMYKNEVPDNPGGGTVDWTNAWGKYKYVDNIEVREDGGTPGFLQSIKTALAIKLKNKMGVANIRKREEELLERAFEGLDKIKNVEILSDDNRDRLGVISFYVKDIHYNLLVRLLNDLYGVQMRGGCACAGTYGHYLLEVTMEKSNQITELINSGDLSQKPGWVRWSLHPTMTNEEVDTILNGLDDIIENIESYKRLYHYNKLTNEFWHKDDTLDKKELIESWFRLDD